MTVYVSGTNSKTMRSTWGDWTLARNGISLTIFDPVTIDHYAGTSLTASHWLYRTFLYFDLSSIPAGSNVIGDAVIKLYFKTKGTSGTYYPILIQAGHQAGATIVTGDWDLQTDDPVSFGSILLSDIILNQYNSITLSAVGKAYIEAAFGSTLKLCVLGQRDFANDAPGSLYNAETTFNTIQDGSTVAPVLDFVKGKIYPTDPGIRVTGLRHIYRPGSYRLEALFGDISTAVMLPAAEEYKETLERKELASIEERMTQLEQKVAQQGGLASLASRYGIKTIIELAKALEQERLGGK